MPNDLQRRRVLRRTRETVLAGRFRCSDSLILARRVGLVLARRIGVPMLRGGMARLGRLLALTTRGVLCSGVLWLRGFFRNAVGLVMAGLVLAVVGRDALLGQRDTGNRE